MSDYRYCRHCGWYGHVEDTVGDRVFDSSWRDDPEYQDWGSCPECHLGTVEGAKCMDCGEPYPAADLDEHRCPDCFVDWKAGREFGADVDPARLPDETAVSLLWSLIDNIGGGK